MMSSWQIAQAIQMQNQMFMGAAQFSQQISQQVPQPFQAGSGLGAWGGGGGQQNPFPQISGAANQQPGFNYGGAGMGGYGMGNQFAAKAMSGIGGAGSAMSGMLGVAAGFGPMSLGLAAMPVTAFAKHAFGSMVTGAQEQAGVNSALGGMNFQNMGSRTGRGFTRQDSSQIGDMMRQMAVIPEMLTSMGELTRITDKIIQTGQMQGVRDATTFQRKWKEAVTQLKDVAKIMGTSMEGALPFLQEAKQMGLHSRADVANNMYQRQMLAANSGMNQQQIGQLQMMGSQMSHQMGGSRRGGTLMAARTAEQISSQLNTGGISNEYLMEMTGAEGAEGIQQLSAMRMQAGAALSRGVVGNVLAMGLGKKAGGRYTGEMDAEMAEGIRSGRTSLSDALSSARGKTSGRGAKISFVTHRKKLQAEMMNALGPEGIAQAWKGILDKRGWGGDEDVANLILQRSGLDDRTAQDVLNQVRQLPRNLADRNMNEDADKGRMQRQQYMRQNFSADALKKKIQQRISNVVTEPFKEIGAKMHTSLSESMDNFLDSLTGEYRAELKQSTASLLQSSFRGDKGSRQMAQRLSGGYSDRNAAQARHGWGAAGASIGYEAKGSILGTGLQRAFDFAGGRERAGSTWGSLVSSMDEGRRAGEGSFMTEMTAKGSGTTDDQMRNQIAGEGRMILDEKSGVFKTQSKAEHGRFRQHLERTMGAEGRSLAESFQQQNPEGYKYIAQTIKAQLGTSEFAKMSAGEQLKVVSQRVGEWAAHKENTWGPGGLFRTSGEAPSVEQGMNIFGSKESMVLAIMGKEGLGGYGTGKMGELLKDQNDLAKGALGGKSLAQWAQNRKQLERDLSSNKAFSATGMAMKGGMGWGEFKSAIDKQGSLAQNLLFGSSTNPNNRGLFRGPDPNATPEQQREQAANREKLFDALQKDPKTWSDEDKKVLREVGEDPEKLASDPARREEMQKLARTAWNTGPETGEKIYDLMRAQHAEGLSVVSKELEDVGARMATALRGESMSKLAGSAAVGKKETAAQKTARERFMKEYGAEAKELGDKTSREERVATGAMPFHLTEAAKALSEMSPEAQKLAQGGMDRRGLAVAQEYQHARGTARKSKDLGGFLHRMGFKETGEKAFGEDDAGRQSYSQLKKMWEGSKSPEDRAKAVADFFAKQRESSLKAGGVQGNKYESEEATAKAMLEFAGALTKWSQEVNSKIGGEPGK